ncbi:MAG: F0F1 ATP synthase subunit B [bacterium]
METALHALGLNFKLILVQAAGFLVLFLLLKKFLFGRITDALRARREEVRSTYAKSEQEKAEAEKLKQDYQKRLDEIEAAAEEKIQAAIKKAEEISNEIISKTHQEAEKIKAKAFHDIDLGKRQALTEIRDQVVNLTILASSKIIEKSIDQPTAERLVDEFIDEVGRRA